MRYRRLDSDGDYTFGRSAANFLIDSPAAVAQAVRTRLLLQTGEWYLDTEEGTPWSDQIQGKSDATRDLAIKARILGTPGVTGLVSYQSSLDPQRRFTVSATISTQFGQVTL